MEVVQICRDHYKWQNVAEYYVVKDKSVALDNLPDPDVLAEEIAENLESALGSFREVIRQLRK